MPGINIDSKGDTSVGGSVAGRDMIDVVVNQYFTATQAAARPEAQKRLRVLVVAPDPLGQPLSPLSIPAEWAAFVALARRFKHPVAVIRLNPPTFKDLQAAVADRTHPFDVIHFIAHGNGESLALEARDGTLDIQPYSKIAECLALSPAQLIVLNVCKSLPLAEVLKADATRAIIAAAGNVPDKPAVEFADGLYAGLFGQQPIAEALKMGERVMSREGIYTLSGDGNAMLRAVDGDAGPIIFPGDPPHNAWLPGYSDKGFVGREGELRDDFFKFFDPGAAEAALFLTGIGGIGKTTLATAAARRYGWRFTGGIVSVSAKDVTNFGVSNVVSAIDAALGTEAGKTADSVSAALNILNDGPHLLILDNLETMETREARRDLAQFVARLDASTGARAVLTMRPRALPEFTDVRHRERRVGPLPRDEAVKMLSDRAQDDGRKRMAGHETEVAKAAYYHPALLAFAAGRLSFAPLDIVLNWLHELEGDSLDDEIPSRLGAMVADVTKVAPDAARILCALAVFSGGATREALEAIYTSTPSLPLPQSDGSLPLSGNLPTGEGAGMGVNTTLPLTELVKGNLAELDANDRYSLQSLVAQWARQHGPYTPDEWLTAARKHAEYFLAFAQKHEQEYRTLEPELENLLDAFAFLTAEATRDDELTRSLVRAMDFFLDMRGYWDERMKWLQAYGEVSERLSDRAGLAATYNNIGLIHTDRGDYAAALEWYEKSVAISNEFGNHAGLATTYNNIGHAHHARGDYAAALEWYKKSTTINEELGNRAVLATTSNNIGEIHRARGDYDAALTWFEKSIAISDELGNRALLATTYNNIGMIHDARRDYAAALEWYEKDLAISEELGDRAGLEVTYNNIGMIHNAQGDYIEAAKWLEKSLAICDEIGAAASAATTRKNLEAVRERMTSPPPPLPPTKTKGVVGRGEPKEKRGERKKVRGR